MSNQAKVFYSDVWGLREQKYDYLDHHDVSTTDWQELHPQSESYLLVPQNTELLAHYERFWKVTDVFPVNGVGITTAHDDFVIDMSKTELVNRMRRFSVSIYSGNDLYTFFQVNIKTGWDIDVAHRILAKLDNINLDENIVSISYRPFDHRYIFYHDAVVWRTVRRVMAHMQQANVALITARSNKSQQMDHFFCTDAIMETKCGERTTQSCMFPLYLYPDPSAKKKTMFDVEITEKTANINPRLIVALQKMLGEIATSETPRNDGGTEPLAPEAIFNYIYAVLYSNVYREKYADFLKRDFPRVPFTRDYELFVKLGGLGQQLVDLHLLKSPVLEVPIAKFEGTGDGKVEKPRFEAGKVWINATQHFDCVPAEVWQYQIGGYQVCDKWLKDRKGRSLSANDIRHYCRVVTALERTIEVQKQIDELYGGVEKEMIDFV